MTVTFGPEIDNVKRNGSCLVMTMTRLAAFENRKWKVAWTRPDVSSPNSTPVVTTKNRQLFATFAGVMHLRLGHEKAARGEAPQQ